MRKFRRLKGPSVDLPTPEEIVDNPEFHDFVEFWDNLLFEEVEIEESLLGWPDDGPVEETVTVTGVDPFEGIDTYEGAVDAALEADEAIATGMFPVPVEPL